MTNVGPEPWLEVPANEGFGSRIQFEGVKLGAGNDGSRAIQPDFAEPEFDRFSTGRMSESGSRTVR